jgi:hypothetical protein
MTMNLQELAEREWPLDKLHRLRARICDIGRAIRGAVDLGTETLPPNVEPELIHFLVLVGLVEGRLEERAALGVLKQCRAHLQHLLERIPLRRREEIEVLVATRLRKELRALCRGIRPCSAWFRLVSALRATLPRFISKPERAGMEPFLVRAWCECTKGKRTDPGRVMAYLAVAISQVGHFRSLHGSALVRLAAAFGLTLTLGDALPNVLTSAAERDIEHLASLLADMIS